MKKGNYTEKMKELADEYKAAFLEKIKGHDELETDTDTYKFPEDPWILDIVDTGNVLKLETYHGVVDECCAEAAISLQDAAYFVENDIDVKTLKRWIEYCHRYANILVDDPWDIRTFVERPELIQDEKEIVELMARGVWLTRVKFEDTVHGIAKKHRARREGRQ